MNTKAISFVPQAIRDSIKKLEDHQSIDADEGGPGQKRKYDDLLSVAKALKDYKATLPGEAQELVDAILRRDKEGITVTRGVLNSNSSRLLSSLKTMQGGRKSRKLGNTFNRCVKAVRQTVKARKGSNKESAAIAICTKSVLHTRGKTMKRYRKGRLITQKKFRGGCGPQWGCA